MPVKCRSIAAAVVIAVVLPTALMIPVQAAGISPEAAVNRGVVQLETVRAAGISVRIAEDLASIIDDGATRRVLPVVGQGSLQNLTDLKLLRGIDMAILQLDVLDYARQQNLPRGGHRPDRERRSAAIPCAYEQNWTARKQKS
jgi:uncharacterized protein